MVISFKDAEMEEQLEDRAIFNESPSLVAKRDLERFYWLLTQPEAKLDLSEDELGLLVSVLQTQPLRKPWAALQLDQYVWRSAEHTKTNDTSQQLIRKLKQASALQLLQLVDQIEQYKVRQSKLKWKKADLISKDDTELSARELEILQLLVQGLSNFEIGERLFISKDTVRTHIHHMMRKLAAADRTDIAVKALRDGIVS